MAGKPNTGAGGSGARQNPGSSDKKVPANKPIANFSQDHGADIFGPGQAARVNAFRVLARVTANQLVLCQKGNGRNLRSSKGDARGTDDRIGSDRRLYKTSHTFYRRSAMRASDAYIEIWVEKEALAGIVYDAASEYDVPVVVSKGMPSLTQLHGSFTNIYRASEAGKNCFIYQFGDHDPTGVLIPQAIADRMMWFCERYDCQMPIVERRALTPEQIEEHDLPTRPTKRVGNTHAADFKGPSVELDALPGRDLRDLVLGAIEQHISPSDVAALREAEESERELLERWAESAPRAAP